MQTIKNIYCIGRNYVEHVHELGNVVPDQPVVFSKPTHALIEANNNSIELPLDKGDIHYEAELVLKIGRDYDSNITVDEIVSQMTVGLDLTLRDVQSELKEKEHPWLLAKGFHQAAVLGQFIPFLGEEKCKQTKFSLYINDKCVQIGDINKMIFPLQSLITFIGENLGLKKGDIIYTGTPEGVGPLKWKDHIKMVWGEQVLGTATVESS